MYLRKLELTDFRAFSHLSWELKAGEEAGWHVLIGPNGSGKSSFVRAAAIAFTGAIEFGASRRPGADFIRKGNGVEKAVIALEVTASKQWDTTGRQGPMPSKPVKGSITLHADGSVKSGPANKPPVFWGDGKGWFSAAFGPMRRFTGGNPESARLSIGFPRLARHLSIFDESIALTEALEWLRTLRFKQLEHASADEMDSLLGKVRKFVNQPGFLPHGARLAEVSSERIMFLDGNGVEVPMVEMSDGYRAVLSMTFELLRLMNLRYDEHSLFSEDALQVLAPGVVLIDEVDTHLHPSWQREIGPWLTRLFPAVQFIVTTHSPYICQTARSVWRLPVPGTGDAVHRVTGEQLQRVLFGDVLHVLNSDAFGGLPGRSKNAVQMLDRLARLNRGLDRGALSAEEQTERNRLERDLAPVVESEFT